ncbi:MAG: hypothetical protein KKC46_15720 [Proteobacteria bacterium]|nr:hypothetical protein [Pseudomonadota bacterium]
MTEKNTININANIELSISSLETIVDTAKKIIGRNEKGYYRIETADVVSQIISRFLDENNFESYIKDLSNYDLPSMK